VISNPNAKILVCKPCAEARGITQEMLTAHCAMGGMNDFHEQTSRAECKAICF
jgi:sulfur relay (sulfurtransferase) complex TusBCD TusD component (DsrE family)